MARSEKPGTIVQINLGNGEHTYARELQRPYIAFYDAKTTLSISLEEIIKCPILFIVTVIDEAYLQWSPIGFISLKPNEIPIPEQFVQDIANPAQITLLDKDGNARPGTFEMIQGLERVAAWDYTRVEQRIRDHYANRSNETVEILKPEPIINIPLYFHSMCQEIVEPLILQAGYRRLSDESKLSDQHYWYKYTKFNTALSEINIEAKVSRNFFWLKVGTNLGSLRNVAQYPNPSPTNVFDEKDWLFRNQDDLEITLQDIANAFSLLFNGNYSNE